jgi:hypothetical protein
MKRIAKNWGSCWAVALLFCLLVGAFASETKWATHATASTAAFAPAPGGISVKSVFATSDKAGSLVKFYGRTGNRYATTAAPTSGATVVALVNTGTAITNANIVAYVFANDRIHVSTVASATTTNITLDVALPAAGAIADRVYKLGQVGQIGVGATSIIAAGELLRTPSDSPLYVVLDSTSAGSLQVTAE